MAGGEQGLREPHNARIGALALAIGASLNLGLQIIGPPLQPLNYAAWLVASFGLLSFCEVMGSTRPLNRAGLVLLAGAFCADTAAIMAADPLTAARARLLYAFTVLAAVTVWSIALMHRRGGARRAGLAGAAAGVGAIALLIGAHLMIGAATIFGFDTLFSALTSPAVATSSALVSINALLAAWSAGVAWLMWTDRLQG